MNLSKYTSSAPVANTIGAYLKGQGLTVGTENVSPVKMSLTDSFSNFNGTPKPDSDLPDWNDPTDQLAVSFISTEGHGVHTHRFNLQGFKRWTEMTEEELKDKAYEQAGIYACTIEENDQVIRVLDDTRSKTAIGMLDQLFAALGLPLGSTVHAKDAKDEKGKPNPMLSLEHAISSGMPMTITLRYDGEYDNWEITGFGKYSTPTEKEKTEAEKAEAEQSFTD